MLRELWPGWPDSRAGAIARAGGAQHLLWHLAPNARGNRDRVSYLADDSPMPGWYAYVRTLDRT